MSLNGDYTSADVPQGILDKVIEDARLYVDVLGAGPMAGTSLDAQTAARKGLVKNHWVWRVLISGGPGSTGQIVFGFNITSTPSVASNAVQYVGSSRAGSGSPYASSKEGSDGAVYSDVGGSIKQPTEGAPVPGILEIKVRPRTQPSWSAYTTHTFRLKPGTTFGQLLDAMTSRNMEPFRFRKINSAYLGCRDGISQAAAAWLADGLMLAPECTEEPHEHIYFLLGWRYARPGDSENLTDSANTRKLDDCVCTVNWIDRAVWPANFVHVKDALLNYNQPTDA